MHILGHGEPVELATALHDALSLSGTPFPSKATASMQSQATGAVPTPQIDLNMAMISQTLRAKGQVNGGVLQFGIPQADKITDEGMTVPPSIGTGEVINFQPTGLGKR